MCACLHPALKPPLEPPPPSALPCSQTATPKVPAQKHEGWVQAEGGPAMDSSLQSREQALLPVYRQMATAFAEMHDSPVRMVAKGVLRGIVPWQQARPFLTARLRRRYVHTLPSAQHEHYACRRCKREKKKSLHCPASLQEPVHAV